MICPCIFGHGTPCLKNCDLIGASWGVSMFGNEEHANLAVQLPQSKHKA